MSIATGICRPEAWARPQSRAMARIGFSPAERGEGVRLLAGGWLLDCWSMESLFGVVVWVVGGVMGRVGVKHKEVL